MGRDELITAFLAGKIRVLTPSFEEFLGIKAFMKGHGVRSIDDDDGAAMNQFRNYTENTYVRVREKNHFCYGDDRNARNLIKVSEIPLYNYADLFGAIAPLSIDDLF